jgi:hypothetical protein
MDRRQYSKVILDRLKGQLVSTKPLKGRRLRELRQEYLRTEEGAEAPEVGRSAAKGGSATGRAVSR